MSINSGGRSIDNTRDSIIPTNNEKQNKQNESCRVRQITPKTNYMPTQNDLDANKSKQHYTPVRINNRKVKKKNFVHNKLSSFYHSIVKKLTAFFNLNSSLENNPINEKTTPSKQTVENCKSNNKTSNINVDPQLVRIENYIARLTSITLRHHPMTTRFKARYDDIKNKKQTITTKTKRQDISTIQREIDLLTNDLQFQLSNLDGFILSPKDKYVPDHLLSPKDEYRLDHLPEHIDQLKGEWWNLYDDTVFEIINEYSPKDNSKEQEEIIQAVNEFVHTTYSHMMAHRENYESQIAEQYSSTKGANTNATRLTENKLKNYFFNDSALKKEFSNNVIPEIHQSEAMVCTNPPLALKDTFHGNLVDKNHKDHFKPYLKSGPLVDYSVWPALLLYKDGPILLRGVSQKYKPDPKFIKIVNYIARLTEKVSANNPRLKELKERYVDLEKKNKTIFNQWDGKNISEKKSRVASQDALNMNKKVDLLSKDLLDELSCVAGERMKNNRARVADLGDPIRAEKIAEKWRAVYDNDWTAVVDECESSVNTDEELYKAIHRYIENTYNHWVQQREKFHKLREKQYSSPDGKKTNLPDVAKDELRTYFFNDGVSKTSFLNKTFSGIPASKSKSTAVTNFINNANTLIAEMVFQDPPILLDSFKPGDLVNKFYLTEFLNRGTHIKYMVWPGLLLSKDDFVMVKGIYQGYTPK